MKNPLDVPQSITEPDLFKQMIKVSVGFHLALFLFFGVKAAIFPNEPLTLDSAIRVDMVGLPDKVAQLPQEPPKSAVQAAPKPVEAPKPLPKVEPKPAPVVLKSATKSKTLEKIKKLEKEEQHKKFLDKIMQEAAQEEAKAARQEKLNQVLKGNTVSPGSSLHGLVRTQFNEYLSTLHDHVQKQWNLPEWLQNDSLKAQIVVYIDSTGKVVKRVVQKSSGDSRFDSYALKAVDMSSPFPSPPEKFVDLVKVDGIILEFP